MSSMEVVEMPTGANTSGPAGVSRSLLIFLITTVFLTGMGFTIIGPVTPFLIQEYVSVNDVAGVIGWLSASYAICQFFAAPILGVVSDRYGRKPVLLICLFGTAVGYFLFGIGGALWVLFLSRILDGLTGGDLAVLFAFIGDSTPAEERGKIFGQVGAAVGISFIVGPVIGGFVANWGYSAPLYLAATVVVLNMLWAFFLMPESLRPEHRTVQIKLADLNPIHQLGKVFAITKIRWLLIVGICYRFPIAMLTTLLAVLSKDALGWQPLDIGLAFLLIGGTDIVMQGFLSGRLLPIFGEIKLTIAGLATQILSYLLVGSVAFVHAPLLLLTGIFVFSVGSGLLEPALGALVSVSTDERQQGIVQGGNQSLRALTQIVGPILAGVLYVQFGGATPFFLGAVVLALGIGAAIIAIQHLPPQPAQAPAGGH